MGTRYAETAVRMEKLFWIRHILHRRMMDGFLLYRGQLPMLEYIRSYPGCTQAEVSKALLVSPSSVAQSTKRMQRGGLLEKRMEDDNQRCKRLFLTEKGRTLTGLCGESFEKVDAQIFSALGEEEFTAFDGYVRLLLQNAGDCAALDVESMDFFTFMKLKREWHTNSKEGQQL